MNDGNETTKPKRFLRFVPRISMRTMLILLTVLCLLLGTWVTRWQRQKNAVQLFEERGSSTSYELWFLEKSTPRTAYQNFREWVAGQLGPDASINVIEAHVADHDQLKTIASFPYLKNLIIACDRPCQNYDLSLINRLRDLEHLHVEEVFDLSFLTGASALRHLQVVNGADDLVNADAINGLSNLENIFIDGQVKDLNFLRGTPKLKTLNVNAKNLSSLEPLSYVRELEVLLISDCSASDYQPLKNLKRLRKLEAYGSRILDLGPLHELKELEELFINNTPVDNIEALAGLPKLAYLRFNGTEISDISPLAQLPSYRGDWNNLLELSETNVTDFSVLQQIPQITGLEVSSDKVSGTYKLSDNSLSYLSLSGKGIDRIQGLEKCTGVKNLRLGAMQVTDLSELSQLKILDSLSVTSLPVKKLPDLRELPLREVFIEDCPVDDISGVVPKSLVAAGFKATNVANLDQLKQATNLTLVKVSGDSIANIDALGSLPKLDWVEIKGTRLESLDGIKASRSLTELSFESAKYLADVSAIKSLDQLTHISIRNCVMKHLEFSPKAFPEAICIADTPLESIGLNPNRCSMLSNLQLNKTQVTDLPFLRPSGIQSPLAILDLNGTPINDFSFLKSLTGLQAVNLANTKFIRLDLLTDAKVIHELNVANTRVTDISPLPNIGMFVDSSMKDHDTTVYLNLSGLKLSDYSVLGSLNGVSHLDLFNTDFSDLKILAELDNLKHLDISDTEVTDLSPIPDLMKVATPRIKAYNLKVSDQQKEEIQSAFPNLLHSFSD